jgi:catechol 2,3-dioxygenase-like lactoylglutathione lyase family enzyme
MIGRLHHVILDCPDPAALAAFYAELLGQPVTYTSDDFVVVAASDTSSGLAFQLAPDHRPQPVSRRSRGGGAAWGCAASPWRS